MNVVISTHLQYCDISTVHWVGVRYGVSIYVALHSYPKELENRFLSCKHYNTSANRPLSIEFSPPYEVRQDRGQSARCYNCCLISHWSNLLICCLSGITS